MTSRRRGLAWLRRRFHYGSSAGPLARRYGDRLAGPPLAGFVAPVALAQHAVTGRLPADVAVRVGVAAPVLTASGLVRWLVPVWGAALLPLAVRRRVLLVVLALPAVVEWGQRRPPLGPVRWVVACAVDDAAYGAGVWWGCLRARTARPLLPRVRGGRRSPRSGSTPAMSAGARSAGDGGGPAHDDAGAQ